MSQNDSSYLGKKLQLARAGAVEFGIFADNVAAIVDWRQPTPLPESPASVLGVVSVKGRMLTVLDLARLQIDGSEPQPNQLKRIIALKGDEQLALAVDSTGETIEITSADAVAKPDKETRLVVGVLKNGSGSTLILNVNELFPASIQGRERRRRRF